MFQSFVYTDSFTDEETEAHRSEVILAKVKPNKIYLRLLFI
jgi:hypothetical protein